MNNIVQSNDETATAVGTVNDKTTISEIFSSVLRVEDEQVENGTSKTVCHELIVSDSNETLSTQNNSVVNSVFLSDQVDNAIAETSSNDIVADAEIISAIITQVEYYFSDANLPTDKFMLQQIARDKYGFVALSVIATFKKMKKLSTDIRVIACALSQSSKLEMSKNGTRVRRTHSLTADIGKLSRMAVAVNLQDPTIDSINQQFSVYGTIECIFIICRGEFVTGTDVRRQVRGGLDSFGKAATGIALIEYEKHDSARMACEHLTDSSNWRHGLHVSMVILPQNNSKKQSSKNKDVDPSDSLSTDNGTDSSSEANSKKKRLKNPVHSRIGDLSKEEVSRHACNEQECGGNCQSSYVVNGQSVSPKCSPNASPKLNHRVTADGECPKHSSLLEETAVELGDGGPKGVNPWMQRRLKASQLNPDSAVSAFAMDSVSAGFKKTTDVLSVIRQPKGPDGSKGFCLIRA